MFSSIANEIVVSKNLLAAPAAIVVGGEITVKVTGRGLGGRNQVALSAALKLNQAPTHAIVVASVGTDGVDGPTAAAGAIADALTTQVARSLKLEPEQFLAANDSYRFFERLDDRIFTGQTGTNVNNLHYHSPINPTSAKPPAAG